MEDSKGYHKTCHRHSNKQTKEAKKTIVHFLYRHLIEGKKLGLNGSTTFLIEKVNGIERTLKRNK